METVGSLKRLELAFHVRGANIVDQIDYLDSDSWAAYGRFIYASVRTRCSDRVEPIHDRLMVFRRRYWNIDTAMVYAWQHSGFGNDSILKAATRALETISHQHRFDHLNLYIGGRPGAEEEEKRRFQPLLDGRYMALIIPLETRDVLELAPSFEEYLQSLGRSNRRHLRARQKAAMKAGIQFVISSDPGSLPPKERFNLGLHSRPTPYRKELVKAFDAYSMAQPHYYHATLRSSDGELLSYCSGFVKQDSAVVMYQFNHRDYPDLSLSMTMRGFLIQHWIELGLRRMVLPMGMNGNLAHAAGVNPVTQVFILKRSLRAAAKAILLRLTAPRSDAAMMVGTKGFLAHLLQGK